MSDKIPSIMRTVTPSQSATPPTISERITEKINTIKASPIKDNVAIDIIKINRTYCDSYLDSQNYSGLAYGIRTQHSIVFLQTDN